MLRIKTALAIGLILGLTSLTASAGELSYESRGYGGPLYIGPNFQAGGQHSPPTYGSESSSSGYHSNSREERAPRHVAKKKSTTHETVTEKAATPADTKPAVTKAAEKTDTDKATSKTADTENSSITTASRTDTAEVTGTAESKHVADPEAAPSSPSGCKRFVAAVGAIITVPCD